MILVAERQTARRELPGRAERLRQIRIVAGDALGERRELLLDAREPRLVFLELFFLLEITPEKTDLLDEICQKLGDV